MAASVSVLAKFTNGAFSSLLVDGGGNLLLTNYNEGGQPVTVFEPSAQASNAGAIGELVRNASGYASTVTSVAEFSGSNGIWPQADLIADASGNLYGTTWIGGSSYNVAQNQHGLGSIFEIANGPNGYSSTVTSLASFTYISPNSPTNDGVFPNSLVMDAQGNLFGATLSGTSESEGTSSNGGVLFEIVKNGSSYSSTPIDLAQFHGGLTQTMDPQNILIDANGDLFGRTHPNYNSTPNEYGTDPDTVFELVKTANGYAASPITLASSMMGSSIQALTMDAKGDLFGSLVNDQGSSPTTLFEIVKTNSGYQPVTTLLALGTYSVGSLIVDANGDLFGVAIGFAGNSNEFVFELAKTASGYAAAPTIIVSSDVIGGEPGSLTADKAGNLFGIVSGSAANSGELVEITNSGFAVTASSALSANHAGLVTSSVTVADSAANVSANLDGLEALVAAGKLSSITLTDSGTPTLSITAVQTADAAAIKDITGNYALSITNGGSVTVTNPTTTQETLVASTANTTVTGAGYDVLDLSHNPIAAKSTAYTLTSNADGSLTIATSGSSDHVSGVEQLVFSDLTITVTPKNSFDEYAALLYQGALGRTPDAAGLQTWEKISNALPAATQASGVYGLSDASGNYNGNLSVAGGFTNSNEFVAKYGSLTDAQFVTQLYANILDRAPDSGGYASWIKALTPVSQGGLGETREHVLIGFAESQEAMSNATQGFTGQSGTHAAWLFLA